MSTPFEEFLRGYVAALLWSSTDEVKGETVHLDAYGPSTELLETCRDQCWAFYQANETDIDSAALLYDRYRSDGSDTGYDFAGHDFALTRNGHGAGYWDRDELEEGGLGQRLTAASEAAGQVNPYLGDDNLVYQLGGPTVYTYTPDMNRPNCPKCGVSVPQTEGDPEKEWQGTCRNGHTHTFQLESEEDE